MPNYPHPADLCDEELKPSFGMMACDPQKPKWKKEIDGLVAEAKRNNLPEVAEWFIKNKYYLSVPGTGSWREKRYYEPIVAAAMCDKKDVIKFLHGWG